MSFLSVISKIGHTLETVGSDIAKGIAIAEPIVAAIPGVGTAVAPILAEIETIITNLEKAGVSLTSAQISQISQSVAVVMSAKQAASPAVPQMTTSGTAVTIQTGS